MSPLRRPRGERGFSFVEILVVMGIIAVLAGMVVVAIGIISKKGPEQRTQLLLRQVRGSIDAWRRRFGTYPPGDPTQIAMVTTLPNTKVPKLANTTNLGNESLYQSLFVPGFSGSPELREPGAGETVDESGDVSNTDDDRLDKSINVKGSIDLYEIKDAWGNPFVYYHSSQYAVADKQPHVYVCGSQTAPEPAAHPKPYKSATGGFVNADSYQLFSMGPDSIPNTEDDIKAWD